MLRGTRFFPKRSSPNLHNCTDPPASCSRLLARLPIESHLDPLLFCIVLFCYDLFLILGSDQGWPSSISAIPIGIASPALEKTSKLADDAIIFFL